MYEKPFEKFEEQELAFRADLGEVHDLYYWQSVNKLVELLKHTYMI